MNKAKILTVLLAVVLMISMAACGEEAKGEYSRETSGTQSVSPLAVDCSGDGSDIRTPETSGESEESPFDNSDAFELVVFTFDAQYVRVSERDFALAYPTATVIRSTEDLDDYRV